MPIRIHRCSCVCGGQRATSGASPVTVHLLKEGEEGEGRRDQSGGREEESKGGEESKKGKGNGKRKNRGREAEVRASVYFITLLEVFVSSTC